jgi:hypothetical protein
MVNLSNLEKIESSLNSALFEVLLLEKEMSKLLAQNSGSIDENKAQDIINSVTNITNTLNILTL